MSDSSNAGGSPLMERPVNGAIDDKSTPNGTSTDNGTSDIEKTAAEAKPENGAADSKSKPESQSKLDTDATRTITGLRWILVCVPLYVSIFVYGLDATIAADVQSPIVEAFGHVDQLAWIGFGFPLGSVAVISLCGVMYTKFNMKWSYIASLVVFEVGSALCGAAPNMGALIVGRVIAGAGGSGLYMGCLNLFTSFTSPQERGTYITGTGISWGVGAVLGPVIGGCFTSSSVTWRFAFYINLIIAAVFTPPTLFALPSVNPSPGVSIMDRLKKIDFLGLLLGIGVWVCFTMAFTMAGGQWPWDDGRTIGTIVAFAVIFVLWAIQQTFCILTTAEDRSIPVHLLRHRSQILLYMATSSTITSLFIIVYYIPIYFQFVHGDTALEAAVRLLPYIAVTVTLNLGSGHLLSKVKYYKPIYVVSGVFIILGGCLLTAYLDPSTSEGYIYGFTVLTAVGSGLTLQVGYAVASLKAHGQEGGALALQNIAQIGGSVIALVIAGQVFQSYAVRDLSKVLAGTGYTKTDIHSIVAGAQSQLFQQLDETLKKQATLAITKAMQKSFILVCVGGGVHLIVSLLMKREKLFD